VKSDGSIREPLCTSPTHSSAALLEPSSLSKTDLSNRASSSAARPSKSTGMKGASRIRTIPTLPGVCQRDKRGGEVLDVFHQGIQELPGYYDRQPLTHDILAAPNLLGAKDDGSGEPGTFQDIARSPQSDDGTTPSVFDDDTDTRDRHDSIAEQSKSPDLLGEYTVSPMLGTVSRRNLSKESTRSLSPPETSVKPLPKHPKQCPTQRSTTQSPSSQIRTEDEQTAASASHQFGYSSRPWRR
jgi:hypothetical protein